MQTITVERDIEAPAGAAWAALTDADAICQWNAALPSWHTPRATLDLREGGAFNYRMEARDGSAGFDFAGTFTRVVPEQRLEYRLDDGRDVQVALEPTATGVHVRQTFQLETSNEVERQREGWQAILDNFARHVEAARRPDAAHRN